MAEHRGIGAFRLFGRSGWLWTLLLLLPVVAVIGYGLWISDPARNPAPAAYQEAACESLGRLDDAVAQLDEAVTTARAEGREASVEEAEAAQELAVEAIAPIANAPDWRPGETLTAQLRAIFDSVDYGAFTLVTGAPPVGGRLPVTDALARPDDPVGTAAAALDVARDQLVDTRAALSEESYGFSCLSG